MDAEGELGSIAIVGMAGRFPGARNLRDYWNNLRDGVESIARLTDTELLASGLDAELISRPNYVKAKGVLADCECFDAAFFGFGPREAELLDPQQRVFLECAWEALEDAGYFPSRQPSSVGVYAGAGLNSYLLNNVVPRLGFELGGAASYQAFVANDKDFLATRVSYKLDLRGPSLTVQTACSTSLVAVATACQALLAYQCDAALAGGVAIGFPHRAGYLFQDGMILSGDGHCRPFDEHAAGTVLGNGAGVVVLKRLADALRDGDDIRAVIRGVAVNNDGAAKAGYTAPSPDGQLEVIAQAQALAGVEPESVSYVEAHGTGTPVGDPIEIAALSRAFGASSRQQFCGIGSVKSNIGHLDAAAGIASLIKVVLALEHEQLPPTLHFKTAGARIRFEDSPFFVVDALRPWPRTRAPRRAGVSAFGIGGTNAHLVLEEAPRPALPAAPAARPFEILTLSARSRTALTELVSRYASFLRDPEAPPLSDVCWTANMSRARFAFRASIVASSREHASDELTRWLTSESAVSAPPNSGSALKVGFLCTGQGSQYVRMGRELYEAEGVFRRELERCLGELGDGGALWRVMNGEGGEEELERTEHAQPALFAIGYALSKLWQSWGVEPAAVLGHSVGEYVAATVAGCLEPEAAMRLVSERGRLMQRAKSGGGMLAVFGEEEEVRELCVEEWGLSVAAENGGGEWVYSGPEAALGLLGERCAERGLKTRKVKTSHAFHSAALDEILDEFERACGGVESRAPRLALVSNVSGRVKGDAPDGKYWRRQARETVRFGAGLATLKELGCNAFIELGPQPVLTSLGQRALGSAGLDWLPSLRRGHSDCRQLFQSLGALFVRGAELDWRAVSGGNGRRRSSLPSYPFERTRHFLEPVARREHQAATPSAGERLLGTRLDLALEETVYEARYRGDELELLADHRYFGRITMPAVGYLALMLAAAEGVFPGNAAELSDITFLRPLTLADDEERVVQTVVSVAAGGGAAIRVASRAPEEPSFTVHATCSARHVSGVGRAGPSFASSGAQRTITRAEFYGRLRQSEVEFGPRFQWIDRLHIADGQSGVELAPARDFRPSAEELLPGLCEACLQALSAAANPDFMDEGAVDIRVPLAIERFWFRRGAAGPYRAHARVQAGSPASGAGFSGDAELVDGDGLLAAELSGVRFQRVNRETLQTRSVVHGGLRHELHWEPEASATSTRPSWGTTLVLCRAPANALVAELEARAGRAILVTLGSSFAALGPSQYRTRAQADDILRVLEESSASAPIERVLYLHASALENAAVGREERGDYEEPGLAELLACGQALARYSGGPTPRLWLVTRSAQAVSAEEQPSPGPAALWGLARGLGVEHPELFVSSVDLDMTLDRVGSKLLLDSLVEGQASSEVLLRNGARHTLRLRRAQPVRASGTLALDPSATYLITGGLGGVGSNLARFLVERGARRLCLIGRRANEAAKAELAGLAELGVNVRVEAIDVSDEGRLLPLLESLKRDGNLRGVFHAAGVLDDGVLLQQSAERLNAVVRPKLVGAVLLDCHTRDVPLDYFVSFSSLSAIIGAPAQAGYAAANAALEAVTHARRARGLPALCVAFGPWRATGMAANGGERARRFRDERGISELEPREALLELEALLWGDGGHAVVARVDWNRMASSSPTARSLLFALADERPTANPATRSAEFLERWRAASARERRELLGQQLREQAARVIGLAPSAPIDPRQPLGELGLDSLMAVELRNALGALLGRSLPASLLFDYPSLAGLQDYLIKILDTESSPARAPAPARAEPESPPEPLPSDISDLSQGELEALLDQKLASIDALLETS